MTRLPVSPPMTPPGAILPRMLQHRRNARDPLWEALLAADDVNRGLFDLQARLKNGLSPAEAFAWWQRLRDHMDRRLLALAGEEGLASRPERACTVLRQGMQAILASWDLSPSQRDRVELWLSQAERERVGAEAAAAA